MSGQVIQDWEPLDHPLVTQLTVHCNYVIVICKYSRYSVWGTCRKFPT
jgi:hypothetical protein